MLLSPQQLHALLRKCLAMIRNALMRLAKAQDVVETARDAAAKVEKQADAQLSDNPVLNAIDRDRHNPRAGVTDAIGVLVDMMDQVAVEAKISARTLQVHTNTLAQQECALSRLASVIMRHAAELDAQLRAEVFSSPVGPPPSGRGVDANPRQAAMQRNAHKAGKAVDDARVACQAAIDAAQERTAKCNSSKAVMSQANHIRKLEHSPHPKGCPKRPLEYSWSSDVTFLQSWENVGPSKPTWGQLFVAPKLSTALKCQTRFSREQLDELAVFSPSTGLTDLRRYHYVKSGSSYFRPTAAVNASMSRETEISGGELGELAADTWLKEHAATRETSASQPKLVDSRPLIAKRLATSPGRARPPRLVVVPCLPPTPATGEDLISAPAPSAVDEVPSLS